MTIGHSETEPFWVEFLRSLARRGLRGVKLVVSDAHEGLKAAITKVLSATWQRCRVHFMRNALAYAGKSQRRIVAAWIGTAFAQDDAAAARKQWREVADQARPRLPKLAALMDEAEADVLAYMGFPVQHRAKLHSTDALDKPGVVGCRFLCRLPYRVFVFVRPFDARALPGFGFSDQALTKRVYAFSACSTKARSFSRNSLML